jgi:CheY-like chemotaxis protein
VIATSPLWEEMMQSVSGSRVLIVEDEYLIASDLASYFENMGAIVVGPVPTVAAAKIRIDEADAAVLDINLGSDRVFRLADELKKRGIPFVFYTGHNDIAIPPRFRGIPRLLKPANRSLVFHALFPQITAEDIDNDDVASVLPKLRLAARLMMGDAEAADRLVASTLERAIHEVKAGNPHGRTEAWLGSMLEAIYRRNGSEFLN